MQIKILHLESSWNFITGICHIVLRSTEMFVVAGTKHDDVTGFQLVSCLVERRLYIVDACGRIYVEVANIENDSRTVTPFQRDLIDRLCGLASAGGRSRHEFATRKPPDGFAAP